MASKEKHDNREFFLVRLPNGGFARQAEDIADRNARKPGGAIYLIEPPEDLNLDAESAEGGQNENRNS
jgi:hypothetical protein